MLGEVFYLGKDGANSGDGFDFDISGADQER